MTSDDIRAELEAIGIHTCPPEQYPDGCPCHREDDQE